MTEPFVKPNLKNHGPVAVLGAPGTFSGDILRQDPAPFGLSPNRQFAIDEDGSALRFKKD